MWLGLVSAPSARPRVSRQCAAARNSALDDHYAVSALARRWSGLVLSKSRWHKATQDILAHIACSPRKAVHTRSRGLHTRKESSFDQKPRVLEADLML